LSIKTGTGTYVVVNVGGGHDLITGGVTVDTGAGHDIVNVYNDLYDQDAGGSTEATVDFGRGASLGLGNALHIGTPVDEIAGAGCTVHLKHTAGDSNPIYVDDINVAGGTLSVEDASTIGDLEVTTSGGNVHTSGTAIVNAASTISTVSVSGSSGSSPVVPSLVEVEKPSTIGPFTISGFAATDFTATSNPTSVDHFAVGISNGGTVTVDSGASVTVLDVSEIATLEIAGTMKLQVGGTTTLTVNPFSATGQHLSITSSPCQLDINDNEVIVNYPTGGDSDATRDNVRNLLVNGRHITTTDTHGWDGTGGITSSYAHTNGNGSNLAVGYADNDALASVNAAGSYDSFGGQAVGSNAILIRMTYGADCNLNGRVDGPDVSIVGTHFNKAGSGQWYLGDFDYSGTCDEADVIVLETTFGKTTPVLMPVEVATGTVPDDISNLAPGPTGLAVAEGSSTFSINWDAGQPWVDHFNVYRSTTSGFTPSSDTLVTSTSDITFSEGSPLAGGYSYYYKITAVDSSGNESLATSDVHVDPLAAPTSVSGGWGEGYPANFIYVEWSNAAAYYNIYREGSYIGSSSDPSYYDYGIDRGDDPVVITYTVTVVSQTNGLESAGTSVDITVPAKE